MAKRQFQILSDLHLEIGGNYGKLNPVADTLLLAGDISKKKPIDEYKKFLGYISSNWKKIYMVLGNHEFYGSKNRSKDVEKYREIMLEYNNIKLLERDSVIDDGYHIMGCTLWSRAISDVGLNDFARIRDENYKRLTTKKMHEWHLKDREWLTDELKKDCGEKIVMTHFMPLMNCDIPNSKYPSDPVYDAYYGNDMYDLFSQADVWISGHTHQRFDFVKNDTRWICAANGYIDEETNREGEADVYEI